MTLRAADDFPTISARYKELTTVPEVKRRGSGSVGNHCSHCPSDPNEHCSKSCAEEAVKAGVIE